MTLIAESDLEAFSNRRLALCWSRAYYLLGLPAAILAAVAAATGLASASGRVPAAILALISAGLGAAVTFLDCEAHRRENDKLCAGWQSMAGRARLELMSLRKSGQHAEEAALVCLVGFNTEKELLLRRIVPEQPRSEETLAAPGPGGTS